MTKGKFLFLLATFGAAAFFLRRRESSRESADLYYEDGSMFSLKPDASNIGDLFSLAGEFFRTIKKP